MNRDFSLDVASGFCLSIVILGHIICFCTTPVNLYVIVDVCCFYLAFFFFKAGVCFRIKENRAIVTDGFKRLIVPYIVYSLLGLVVVIIIKCITIDWMNLRLSFVLNVQEFLRDVYKMGAPGCNLALWFLPSLYICRIISNVIMGYRRSYVIASVTISVPVILEIFKFNMGGEPFYVRNIPIGLSIMFMGYMIKGQLYRKGVFYFASMVYLGLLFIYPSHLSVFEGEIRSGNYITGILALFSGCIMICGISRMMKNTGIARILAYIGKHSMPYFCVHWIIIRLIAGIPYFSNNVPYIRMFVMIASCILLLPLMEILTQKKILKWTIGE